MSSDLSAEVVGHDNPLAMDPEEMRRLGYRAVDMVVERLQGLQGDAAWRGAKRKELDPLWRIPAPEEGMPLEQLMEQAVGEVLPLAARVDHPRFFAFVPSGPTWAAVMADFLAAGFNTFQGTWLGSGGPSALELIVLDWFREWLRMPDGASGLFTSGGSAANLIAIVAALEEAGRPERPSVYIGDQGHSALFRAARIAGVPRQAIRTIPSDGDYRMDMDALADAIAEDRAAGRTPVLVGANGGATNTGAVDPLVKIGGLCEEEGLWFHVDAAYGGFAVLTSKGKEALSGIGKADSVVLDPHKWLFQTFECGCLMVKDPGALERTYTVHPEYLQDTQLGREQVNFGDRGLQLSRQFRALKVWMTVRSFGMKRIRAAVQVGLDLAARAEEHIRASASLEVLCRAQLSAICFRFRPRGSDLDEEGLERLNAEIQERVVDSGFAMMSSTRLKGRYSLRFCIISPATRWEDVRETLDRIVEIGEALVARSASSPASTG